MIRSCGKVSLRLSSRDGRPAAFNCNSFQLKPFLIRHQTKIRQYCHFSSQRKSNLNGFAAFQKKIYRPLSNCSTLFKFGIFPFITYAFFPLINVSSAEIPPNNDLDKNKEIQGLVKQGKKSMINGAFSKAEVFFVRALHLAIEKNDPAVVAYIQDLLANLALQTDQLDKAEPLLRNILQNLISHGKSQNDSTVIETSLKLASVYARMGKKDLALNGYQWTSDTCRKNLKEMIATDITATDQNYVNMQVLLGMILDSYGRYLHDIDQNETALKVTLEALDISLELFGEKHERTLVLYNDLCSIFMELGDYQSALQYLQNAIALSDEDPALTGPSEKAVFYTNLAYIYIKQDKIEEAERIYKQALLEASKSNDKSLQSHVASMVQVFSKKQKKAS